MRDSDNNQDNARLPLGAVVWVVIGDRNTTPHTGVIRHRIWHHKKQCWHYYLEQNGKKVSKRYTFQDLVLNDDSDE